MTTNEMLNWLSGYAVQLTTEDRQKLFRAVSAHEELLEQLKDATLALEWFHAQYPNAGSGPECSGCAENWALIAKAEGK